ncbi:MAG TPA: hypothetical protein VH325_00680 [Bryobacteraceae bacterium]|jgi:hypothetical protein|nr:hypothetical protein [Bryobacteraceae bacterium]
MNRYLVSMLLLGVPLMAQNRGMQTTATHPLTSPRKAAASGKSPAILGAEYFSILPHMVDGSAVGWTTEVVVTNTGTDVESWEVDFYSDSNQSLQFQFAGVGNTSSLTGTLNPGQSVTYTTTGQTAANGAQVDGWGSLNANSGSSISVYQVLVDSLPSFLFASSSSTQTGFGIGGSSSQPGAVIPFDNTSGFIDGLAFTNPDSANQYSSGDTLNVTVYDSNYNQLGTHQVTVAAGNKVLVVMPTTWTETANQKGSLYIYPQGSDFSPISPLAFRFQYLGAAQSFITLPVLQFY